MADISYHVPSAPPEWVKNFAKVGLTAKGVVYCLVGIIAFMAAFELGGKSAQEAGKSGVFQFILEQPYGKWMLGLVALGLLCYAIWRIIQAVQNTEHENSDAKGGAKRLRYAFSGLVYGALAFLAAKMALGNGGGGGGNSRQSFVQELLQQPFGQWLVGILAVAIILTGLYQIYYALSEKYKEKVRGAGMKSDVESKMIKAGKLGYIARGVVWAVIGYLFLKAALQSDSQEAGGSSSAFAFLEQSSYGSFILGAVAIGLICYGIFMFMRAKYQPIYT